MSRLEETECKKRMKTFIDNRLKEDGTINAMMKMSIKEYDIAKQTITLDFPVEPWQLNPAGNMHGGIIATALDIGMGCAAYTMSQASFTPTIQMAVNYVAAIPAGEILEIEVFNDHAGSRMAQLRAIARLKSNGQVAATANGSYIINTFKK